MTVILVSVGAPEVKAKKGAGATSCAENSKVNPFWSPAAVPVWAVPPETSTPFWCPMTNQLPLLSSTKTAIRPLTRLEISVMSAAAALLKVTEQTWSKKTVPAARSDVMVWFKEPEPRVMS